MVNLNLPAGTAKCRECGGRSEPTEWLPSPGYEGMMRQFECQSCHEKWFYTLPNEKQLSLVKGRVKALRQLKDTLEAAARTQAVTCEDTD